LLDNTHKKDSLISDVLIQCLALGSLLNKIITKTTLLQSVPGKCVLQRSLSRKRCRVKSGLTSKVSSTCQCVFRRHKQWVCFAVHSACMPNISYYMTTI